jgi:hypothetical protein
MRCEQWVYVGQEAAVDRTALAGGPYARQVAHIRQGMRRTKWCVAFTCQYEFFDKLVLRAVLFTNILIRDLFLIMHVPLVYTTSLSNANIISHKCPVFLPTPRGRHNRKGTSLPLSDPFNRRKSLNTQQPFRSTLRCSRRVVHPSAHPLSAGPPTTIDGTTANTNHTVFNTPHPRPFCSFAHGLNVRPIC